MSRGSLRSSQDLTTPCPICVEGLLGGQQVWRLPCTHVYHSECIVRWFSTRHVKIRCPECRCGGLGASWGLRWQAFPENASGGGRNSSVGSRRELRAEPVAAHYIGHKTWIAGAANSSFQRPVRIPDSRLGHAVHPHSPLRLLVPTRAQVLRIGGVFCLAPFGPAFVAPRNVRSLPRRPHAKGNNEQ